MLFKGILATKLTGEKTAIVSKKVTNVVNIWQKLHLSTLNHIVWVNLHYLDSRSSPKHHSEHLCQF